MNWRESPFLRLLPPLAAGIWLNDWLDFDVAGQSGILALCLGILAYWAFKKYSPGQRWIFGLFLQFFFAIFGYYLASNWNELKDPAHFSKQHTLPRFFVGTCYDALTKGNRFKIPVHVEAAGSSADSLLPCGGNLILYLDTVPEYAGLRYGDRVVFEAKPLGIEGVKNPQAFDYRRYLHYQNIHFQAFVRPDALRVLEHGQGSFIWRTAYSCRDAVLGKLKKYFPREEEYAVAAALLVGYKDNLSDEIKAAYTQTGSMHALVVSGTHVGVIFTGLLFLFRRLPMPVKRARFVEPLLVLVCIWGFTLLTGASASVVRAAVMFSIFLIGRAMYRDTSVWNVLAASAFMQLLANPYWLFDAGFQLSYTAVVGMVFFHPRFYRVSPVFKHQWKNTAWSTLLVGVSAQLGTLPLSLYYFHQFPMYFWLSGFVVVLGGSLFLYASFFLLFFDLLLPVVAYWLGKIMFGMVWAMNQLIFGIQKLPFGMVTGIWVAAWAAALLYIAIGFLSGAVILKKPKYLMVGLGIAAFLLIARAVQQIGHFDQRKITVYSLSKHSLMDFFDGEDMVSLSDSLPSKQLVFAAQSHRWSLGAIPRQHFHLQDDTTFVGQNFLKNGRFIQFFDKKIIFIDQQGWALHKDASKIKVDAIVLRDNPKVSILDCSTRFDCQFFIFDGTNSRSRAEKWKKECLDNGFTFHDLREQGAWETVF